MQLIKFGLVGLIGTSAQYTCLFLGVKYAGISATFSSSVGFIIAAFINHHFNRLLTFNSNQPYSYTLIRFLSSAVGLFFLNLLLMFYMTNQFNVMYLVAQLISTLVVFIIGFIINHNLVFRK